MVTPAWCPILTGDLERQAREAITDIAQSLQQADPEPDLLGDPPATAASLADGHAGQALLWAYLDQTGFHASARNNALQSLNRALDAISNLPMTASFFEGFTGIAWAAEHIGPLLLENNEHDLNKEIDSALMVYLSQSQRSSGYDLISGLVGMGVYALEGLPRQSARQCLARVVDRLYETALRVEEGTTWGYESDILPRDRKDVAGGVTFDLGVSHGVPGVIPLLARAYKADVCAPRARELVEGAISWLWSKKLTGTASSIFPHRIDPAASAKASSRFAWCYGDPGIAAALLCAARCVASRTRQAQALDLACQAALRLPQEGVVSDACLCHGAAGLGHLFNRMYQSSGKEVLAEASRSWFRKALQMRVPGQGLGGYLSLDEDLEGELCWMPKGGFLTGVSGIALTLLAAITDLDPAWDRVLLVSE